MKKVIIGFCSLIFLATICYGENLNNQKIWHVDSPVYRYLTYLYGAEGYAMPSSVGPWSTAELKKMLLQVSDIDEENQVLQELYDTIYDILYEEPDHSVGEDFCFSVNGEFSPEVYVHSNPQAFSKESDWFYDYEKRKKLLDIGFEAYAGKNIYGLTSLQLGYASYINDDEFSDQLYKPVFMSNIPFVPLKDMACLDLNFPRRALMSFGDNNWNLSFGRDVMRWGNGESGNLLVGGNAYYDNALKFSTFFETFKFTFLANVYPHNQNLNKGGQNDPVEGLKIFLAHRLDFRLFKNRINVGLTEGVLYQSAENTFNIQYLNPMNLFHNYYIRGNGNSILGLDLDYTVINGLNFYGQLILDDAPAIGEPDGSDGTSYISSKMGYLLGSKYFVPLSIGVLKISLEGVYTDPYTYLREKYNEEDGTQGLSLYGHVREFTNHNGIEYIKNCMGYTYGGDCVVGDLKISLESPEKWNAGFELFGMAHGIMYNELNADWVLGKTNSPSTKDIQVKGKNNKKTCPTNEEGVAEYFLRASLTGDYKILDWLSVYGGVDNWFIWNKNNAPAAMVYDLQVHSGVSMKW